MFKRNEHALNRYGFPHVLFLMLRHIAKGHEISFLVAEQAPPRCEETRYQNHFAAHESIVPPFLREAVIDVDDVTVSGASVVELIQMP